MSEDGKDEFGYTSSIYTRVFQAQQTYLQAHIDNESGEFLPSWKAKATMCPEYTACDLDLRQRAPAQCATTPWRAYSPSEKFLCRYGIAVSASLGPVKIRMRGPKAPTHEEIANAAYFRWLDRGGPNAEEATLDDWLWAEGMLRARTPGGG
jgi:hypothetical protein